MRLAGGVADAEQLVGGADAQAGMDRPGGQPGAVALGAVQGVAHTAAGALQPGLHGVARTQAGRCTAQAAQAITPHTAGQGRSPAIGHHHAAVTAVQRQHADRPGGQRRAAEVGLEGEQIRRAARQPALGALRRQVLP